MIYKLDKVNDLSMLEERHNLRNREMIHCHLIDMYIVMTTGVCYYR
jgi:allophanate hydrolase subunit 1